MTLPAAVTTTSTDTTTYYLPTSTKTASKSAANPTRTITPGAVISTVTTVLSTKTFTRYNLNVVNKMKTVTAKCTLSSVQMSADPTATAYMNVDVAVTSSAVSSSAPVVTPAVVTSVSNVRRSLFENIVGDKLAFLDARADRLNFAPLAKRAPDSATVTVIQTDVDDFSTSVNVVTASAVTFSSTGKLTFYFKVLSTIH